MLKDDAAFAVLNNLLVDNINIMKSSLIIFLLLSFGFEIQAQDSLNVKYNRSFFLGLGGPGFGGSLNYQQKVSSLNKRNGLYFRIGVGALGPIPGRDGGAMFVSLPVGLHYNFTKSSKLEIGGGVTPYTFTNDQPSMAGFASLAFYPLRDHALRLVLSPFFHKRSVLKDYFGTNSSVLFYGGIDVLFPLKRNRNRNVLKKNL